MMTRTLYILLWLLCSTFPMWGQVKVEGSVAEQTSHDPISFATVVLKNSKDSTLYKGTVTDLQGKFLFEEVKVGRYLLSVSSIGYETYQKEVRITFPSSGVVWTTEVALHPSSTELGEVVVAGSRQRQLADRKIHTFTTDAKRRAQYAKDLLKELPDFKENTLSGKIESIQGGTLLILINGVKATEAEIRSIPPDKVKSVEVYDVPPARYNAVGQVVNIITHRLDNGMSVGVQSLTSTNARFSNNMAYLSSTRGNHRFDLSYQWEHRNYKERLTEIIYDYQLKGEAYSDQTKGRERFGYDDHDVHLKYAYVQPEQRVFQATLEPKWHCVFANGIHEGRYQHGVTKEELRRDLNDKSKTFIPSLDLYYWQKGKGNDEWSANLHSTYFHAHGNTLRKESNALTHQQVFDDHMQLQNRKYSLIGEVTYSKKGDSNVWNIGYKNEYAHIKSNLSNLFGATEYSSDYLQQYGYIEMVGSRGKFLYKASVGFTHNYNKSYQHSNHQVLFAPRMILGYNLSSFTSFRLGLSRTTTAPNINLMSKNATQLTPDILSTGNPNLLSGSATNIVLMGSHSNRYLNLSAGMVYTYFDKPIEQYFQLQNDKYYLTHRNAHYAHHIGGKLSLLIKPFASDWLTFNAFVAPMCQVVGTPNGTQRQLSVENFMIARIAYKGLELSYQYTIPTYSTSGVFRSLSENASNLLLTYKYRQWKFTAGALFLGQDAHYRTESLPSSIVSYSNDRRIKDNRSMVLLGIEYTFSSGKNKVVNRKLNNKDNIAPTY